MKSANSMKLFVFAFPIFLVLALLAGSAFSDEGASSDTGGSSLSGDSGSSAPSGSGSSISSDSGGAGDSGSSSSSDSGGSLGAAPPGDSPENSPTGSSSLEADSGATPTEEVSAEETGETGEIAEETSDSAETAEELSEETSESEVTETTEEQLVEETTDETTEEQLVEETTDETTEEQLVEEITDETTEELTGSGDSIINSETTEEQLAEGTTEELPAVEEEQAEELPEESAPEEEVTEFVEEETPEELPAVEASSETTEEASGEQTETTDELASAEEEQTDGLPEDVLQTEETTEGQTELEALPEETAEEEPVPDETGRTCEASADTGTGFSGAHCTTVLMLEAPEALEQEANSTNDTSEVEEEETVPYTHSASVSPNSVGGEATSHVVFTITNNGPGDMNKITIQRPAGVNPAFYIDSSTIACPSGWQLDTTASSQEFAVCVASEGSAATAGGSVDIPLDFFGTGIPECAVRDWNVYSYTAEGSGYSSGVAMELCDDPHIATVFPPTVTGGETSTLTFTVTNTRTGSTKMDYIRIKVPSSGLNYDINQLTVVCPTNWHKYDSSDTEVECVPNSPPHKISPGGSGTVTFEAKMDSVSSCTNLNVKVKSEPSTPNYESNVVLQICPPPPYSHNASVDPTSVDGGSTSALTYTVANNGPGKMDYIRIKRPNGQPDFLVSEPSIDCPPNWHSHSSSNNEQAVCVPDSTHSPDRRIPQGGSAVISFNAEFDSVEACTNLVTKVKSKNNENDDYESDVTIEACPPTAMLTVNKVVVTDNGGSLDPNQVPLFVDGNSVTNGVQVELDPGTHTVSETNPAGYAQTIGGDCGPDGSITLAPGDEKTCTITNDDIPGTITVTKIVEGGELEVSVFPLLVDQTQVTSGVPLTVDAGTYTVSETQQDNYEMTGMEGDCDENGVVTVGLNESKTCTITNTYVPPFFARACGEQVDLCTWDVELPYGSPYAQCNLQYNTYWPINTERTATCTFDGSLHADHMLYFSIDNDVVDCTLNGAPIVQNFVHEGCAFQDPRDEHQVAITPVSGENTIICHLRDRGYMTFFDACVVGEGEPEPPVCDPQQEMIANGGFETPEVTNSAKWQIFNNGASGMEWNVEWMPGASSYGGHSRPEIASLELHENVIGPAYKGDQYAELDGDWEGPSSSLNGEPASTKISQSIATVPGREYTISFAFSPRPSTPASDNKLEVSENGNVLDTISIAGVGSTSWSPHSYTFTASSSTTVIQFSDLGTQNSLGTLLDDVSLRCNSPPPPTCGDGTLYGQCSEEQPLYCSDGALVEMASTCGCPQGTVQYGETCMVPRTCSCEGGEGDLYADCVDTYSQGMRKDGTPVVAARSNPEAALHAPQTTGQQFDVPNPAQTTFFATGFGGTVTLCFNNEVQNKPGNDLHVYETTYGPGTSYPAEKARIEGSADGYNYVELASSITRDGDVELDMGQLSTLRFIRITDVSNPDLFANDADAYDVDAVAALPHTGALTVIKQVVNDNGGTLEVSDFPLYVGEQQVSSGVANELEPGTYVVSETGDVGYAPAFSGDCDSEGSVTLVAGDNKVCTITNYDIQPTLMVTKLVTNDNGGIASASSFTMSVTGDSVSNPSFPGSSGTTISLNAGQFSVSEAPSGYSASYSPDCFGTINVGENKHCYVTNNDLPATLIVTKHVDNGEEGELGDAIASDFTMTVLNGSNAVLYSFPGDEEGTKVTLDAGQYSVLESGPQGYAKSASEDCIGAIANGETKYCDITNRAQLPGTIIVHKDVLGPNEEEVSDSHEFWVSLDAGAPAKFSELNDATFPGVTPGEHTLTESAGDGSYVTSGPVPVTVPEDDSVEVTITNYQKAGTITIVKDTVGGDGTFDFTGLGEEGFQIETVEGSGQQTFEELAPGVYTITEQVPNDWTFSSIECGEVAQVVIDGATVQITLGSDESVTCTYTDAKKAIITVIKHVINDEGGPYAASDFIMLVTATNPSSSSFPGSEDGTVVTIDAGSYSVDESAPRGYTKTLSEGCSGTIGAGESRDCTITNDDMPFGRNPGGFSSNGGAEVFGSFSPQAGPGPGEGMGLSNNTTIIPLPTVSLGGNNTTTRSTTALEIPPPAEEGETSPATAAALFGLEMPWLLLCPIGVLIAAIVLYMLWKKRKKGKK